MLQQPPASRELAEPFGQTAVPAEAGGFPGSARGNSVAHLAPSSEKAFPDARACIDNFFSSGFTRPRRFSLNPEVPPPSVPGQSLGLVAVALLPSPDAWPALWGRCWSRIRSWGIPPRWSWADWSGEARAQGALAAFCALTEFDARRGVPRDAFLYRRVIDAVWTRYRQEWSVGRRLRPGEAIPDQPALESPGPDPATLESLGAALSRLGEVERRLIHQLFWDDRSEDDLAREWGISHQAVNKRKQKILGELQRKMRVQ